MGPQNHSAAPANWTTLLQLHYLFQLNFKFKTGKSKVNFKYILDKFSALCESRKIVAQLFRKSYNSSSVNSVGSLNTYNLYSRLKYQFCDILFDELKQGDKHLTYHKIKIPPSKT